MGGPAAAPLAAVPVGRRRAPSAAATTRSSGWSRAHAARDAARRVLAEVADSSGWPAGRAWASRRRAIWRCSAARWRGCRCWRRRSRTRDAGELGGSLATARGPACAGRASWRAEIAAELARVLRADAPAATKDGGFVNAGVSPELDELRDIAAGGRDRIAAIEARERERTGIPSLKVKYNSVFGYYIEVTRAHLARCPPTTCASRPSPTRERFVTPELRRVRAEGPVRRGAPDRARAGAVRGAARAGRGGVRARCSTLAARVAAVDALAALAEVAHRTATAGPRSTTAASSSSPTRATRSSSGWRPAGSFVPNDVRLDPAAEQLLLVTGPNMAGKSTLIRQVALVVILAQMGGFVAGARARASASAIACSRASARATTWPAANRRSWSRCARPRTILRHATARSLVVLDEIGRGTSTYDGVSIAWAVAEHLHDRVGAQDAVRDPLPRAGRAGGDSTRACATSRWRRASGRARSCSCAS